MFELLVLRQYFEEVGHLVEFSSFVNAIPLRLSLISRLLYCKEKMVYTIFCWLIFNFQKLHKTEIEISPRVLLSLALAMTGYFSDVQMTKSSVKRSFFTQI